MKLIKKEKNLKWKIRNKKSQQSLNHKNHRLDNEALQKSFEEITSPAL